MIIKTKGLGNLYFVSRLILMSLRLCGKLTQKDAPHAEDELDSDQKRLSKGLVFFAATYLQNKV